VFAQRCKRVMAHIDESYIKESHIDELCHILKVGNVCVGTKEFAQCCSKRMMEQVDVSRINESHIDESWYTLKVGSILWAEEFVQRCSKRVPYSIVQRWRRLSACLTS